jgi:hypothetical protein
MTGILHLGNKTPVQWFSTEKATIETSTYVSEVVDASCTCDEQRSMLWYLEVPITNDKSYMFGDNKSVVNSPTLVHDKLCNHHTMFSFHSVCVFIKPSDILPMHWGYSQVWDELKTLLFWKFDTGIIQVQGQHAPPSTERGVTNFTQVLTCDVSVSVMTWQSRSPKDESDVMMTILATRSNPE